METPAASNACSVSPGCASCTAFTVRPSPFAPLQLCAQYFKERLLEAQQFRRMLGLGATHGVAIAHRHSDLPVHAEIGFFRSRLHLNLDLYGIAHHHRPVRQTVRR